MHARLKYFHENSDCYVYPYVIKGKYVIVRVLSLVIELICKDAFTFLRTSPLLECLLVLDFRKSPTVV